MRTLETHESVISSTTYLTNFSTLFAKIRKFFLIYVELNHLCSQCSSKAPEIDPRKLQITLPLEIYANRIVTLGQRIFF